MGRTNYSLNELLNAVTKRAFNRYTSQTVDYQHLEAATTKTGLVSNRREYSSASILADTFSLNAANIAESNYDPFLKTFVNNLIDRKTFQIGGSSNTDQFSYAITCTDDRRFLAVTSKFNNTTPNEVRVYEFDESLVEQFELTSSGVIDISGNVETFDVDITNDASETYVAKKVGTTQVVVDKFDQGLNFISSATLMTTSLALTEASISVSEYGGRVAVAAMSDHLFLRVHDNLNTNEYYSLYSDYEVSGTPLALMSKNGRIVVVNSGGTVTTFEIPSASPNGVVTLTPIQTQTMGIEHFDLSYDGKVMLTHSGSDVLIYTWNGLQWKQLGQNIPTGLTQVYSSAISYYADYFVVASDDQIKVFKWNRNSTTFEQYGNTLIGDFGTTGQTTRINMMGNTVVIGNSQTNSNSGRSSTYLYDGERWGIINEINGSTNGDALGKFLRVSNNGDKVIIGSTNEVSVKTSELVNKSSGWKQRGNTLTATTIDDGFGTSLSMSNDGNYLAVGVPDSTGTMFLDGGQQQGSVKIYRFSGGRWSLFGEEILGDGPVDFGKYVSISLDGTKVAVGSDKNSVVKVYNRETNTIPSSSVVDTITLTPEDSTLEMSDDGNRLLTSLAPTTTMLQGLTVVSTSTGNKYSLDGVTQPTLRLQKGVTYTGIASTFTETGSHPLRISASPDGTHAGDSTIIASVVGGNLLIPMSASDTLYYFCAFHPNMGGTIQIEPGLSIWDKNGAGVWGKRGGLTEGDVIHLSNNGNYLSVDYSNTARLYKIDSNGPISKIGDDITLSVVSSPVNTFRSNQPTHINTTTSNSGVLSLASYESTSLGVEIASLTWDSTLHPNPEFVTRSSEITGLGNSQGEILVAKYGIVLSRNGETLVVYEDTQFQVYTYDDTQWNFQRFADVGTCYNVAISYDGTVLAYEGSGGGLFIQNAVSGANMGSINIDPETFAFRNNSYLVICQANTQNIRFYSYTGGTTWTLDVERANGSNFTEVHAQFSGDENRLVIGDVYNSRVKIYEYDTDTTSFNTFIQSGSAISSSTNQVVSGNGNVRVVSYPFAHVSGWFESGYVGIYEKDGNGDWPSTESAVLHGFDFQIWGRSIDISEDGSRIVFNSNTSVYVYHKSGGTWTPLGSSFSGSTTTVAISGDGTKIFNGSATSLHSYQLVSGNWVTYLPTVTTDGNITKIQSSSSGDDIAVEQSSYGGRVYSKQTVSFSELGSSITSIGYNETGSAVAISSNGSRVVIGEYTHDSSRGRVRVFDWNGSLWTQVGADIDGEASYDYSGWSVAMSSDGSRIAIGAPYNDINMGAIGGFAGHVRVYDWNGSSWTQVGADIDGEASYDQSGRSVAMSSDGSRVVIGAPYNRGNGTYSGHVRVYDWNGSIWTQVGADIDGETQYDYSGWSVAMSSDGSRFVVGARGGSGRVSVFQFSTPDNPIYNYELSSSYSGSMIDISNDGNTVVSYSDFNSVFALSGDGTKVVSYANNPIMGRKILLYSRVNSAWTKTHELEIDYTPTDFSINTDGSHVGSLGGSTARFYDVGVVDLPNGWTLHSFIDGGGNTLEKFGSIVDISNDGNTVLVGAPGDGTSSYRGYIKVYDYVSGAWTARLTISPTNPDSSTTTGSTTDSVGYRNFGKSASLSSNGDRVSYIEDEETVTTTTTQTLSTTDTIVMTGSSFDYDTGINTTHNGGSFGTVLYTTPFQTSGIYYYYSMVQFNGYDSGIWLPVTFDRSWSISLEWWEGSNSSLDFVFYAPNQPSTNDHTQHGGYRIIETVSQRSIVSPTGATLASTSVSYPQSSFTDELVYASTGPPNYYIYVVNYKRTFTGQISINITYSNGTITVVVPGHASTEYTFTGSDLTAQQAMWGTQTYMGICSDLGSHVYNINVSWDNYTTNTTSNTTQFSELSVRDITGGTVSNPIATTADPNHPVVDFSEGRELSALSMSKDGTRIGVRATGTGTYDALMKHLERSPNGWTLRGSIIQFTAPSDIASSSLRALVSSSDGNTIAFGMNTAIKVYGFSNNAWSQLGFDIVPGVTNPSEISIDLSSDGTTLAVLIDRTTSDPAVCKVFTFSSGSWSQSGSSIDFRPTGTNKVKISGDGTTIALGNNTPDSPYPFNVIRVYRKGQDWELISPTMTVNKTPTNFFGAGLNLTNNGTKLATFNTSGVEFYTFSTQAVLQDSQYLNDITVSGTTVDVGDIHLSDNGDKLTVLAGDETVRVYDSNHNEEAVFGSSLSVQDFSITKDASSLVLSGDAGTVQVFNYDTSWSQLGSSITTSGAVTTDIKSDGNSIVLVSPSQDLRLYKYENGSWAQASTSTGTRGTSVFISDSDDVIVGDSTNVGRVKTFEIKDVFQDISFTAPTLKLNGDEYIRLNSGSTYVENGATVSSSAAITPTLKISGSVLTREPSVYTIKYEVEDLQRKKADPIFRSIEVIPEVSPIKLEGAGVIYHTQGTSLEDPGVTASVPVSVYHTTPGSSVVVSGFPNFLTATTLGEYKIFYTNDSPDKYLRPSSLVKRSVFVRARPVLTLTGASIVYNPLNQTYVDSGVTFTQTGENSPTVSVSFNAPRVAVSETQTVTYTAKDQFGIEAIPITRQVIVRKRPTITTSGTLYRILNDPISIPAPTVFPETLSGSLQTSNNINRYQLGSYSITYNVTDGDGISANTTRQQYEVGSYGKVTFSQSGTVSAFSRDGRSLAIFSTNVQLYKLGVDGSWESNGSISTPAAVSSMKFSYDGRYIVIGMSSHFTVGLVTVYKENPLFENNWEQLGLDLFGTDYLGKFGHVVEINDFATHIFIGAPEANTNSGALFKAGFVKIYQWNGVFWEEEKIVEGLGPAELLGTSISISRDGNVLAIGSPGHTRTTIAEDGTVTSANVGKTSIYRYVDNVWESYGGTDIDDGTEGGRNAFSLSMSGDGKKIAVGSESGGGVRVYTIQGSRWSPFGSHIPGTFGKSVSLSDENVLVIGSDDESSGRAYVYTLKGDWSKTGTTFDQVIVAPSTLNDMGKRVNVNAFSTFVCIDSETEVRIYSI